MFDKQRCKKIQVANSANAGVTVDLQRSADARLLGNSFTAHNRQVHRISCGLAISVDEPITVGVIISINNYKLRYRKPSSKLE